eukprot:gnl/MRDRNA2_/MRDRNA2_135511_c0_seq1.p1 gnl/MRDRNA2_/MRDRNA2_135511_c0~~gnl/MRDRNA2_/MRDRNA2_135511_c0_seq1.p1  ORF type:complete len:585 (+),score=82.50 gnl/MRDRNA2_/MRDRNA2_135511_c0_seq1:119-1873(+)
MEEHLWWLQVPNGSGTRRILAVLCEDPKAEVFRQAASVCQHAWALSSSSEISLEWGDSRGELTDSQRIKHIRVALSAIKRTVAGYALTTLSFALAQPSRESQGPSSFSSINASDVCAIGLGLNKQMIQRAAYLALFLSKAVSNGVPNEHKVLYSPAVHAAVELASRARCVPYKKENAVAFRSLRDLEAVSGRSQAFIPHIPAHLSSSSKCHKAEEKKPRPPPGPPPLSVLQEALWQQPASGSGATHAYSCTGKICGLSWKTYEEVPIWSRKTKKPWCSVHGCSFTVQQQQSGGQDSYHEETSDFVEQQHTHSRDLKSNLRQGCLRRQQNSGQESDHKEKSDYVELTSESVTPEDSQSTDSLSFSESFSELTSELSASAIQMGAELDALLAPHASKGLVRGVFKEQKKQGGCRERSRSGRGGQVSDLHSDQIALVERIRKGSSSFDPAQNPDALRQWKHLSQYVDVQKLKFTHDLVKPKFLHGNHRGESVSSLTDKLLKKEARIDDIPPLVVVKERSNLWVAFGNRRLKAFQDFQAFLNKPIKARCIIHDLASTTHPVPPALVAKLIASATTRNGGTETSFTRPA